MKNNLIILITFSILILITGCNKDTKRITSKGFHQGISIYCDQKQNVEYLIFKGFRAGGITPRLNSDGTIKTCNKKI